MATQYAVHATSQRLTAVGYDNNRQMIKYSGCVFFRLLVYSATVGINKIKRMIH